MYVILKEECIESTLSKIDILNAFQNLVSSLLKRIKFPEV